MAIVLTTIHLRISTMRGRSTSGFPRPSRALHRTKREASWSLRRVACRVSCVLLRTACEEKHQHQHQHQHQHHQNHHGRRISCNDYSNTYTSNPPDPSPTLPPSAVNLPVHVPRHVLVHAQVQQQQHRHATFPPPPMLEVSLLGVGTVLHLEKHTWPNGQMTKASNKIVPPPRHLPVNLFVHLLRYVLTHAQGLPQQHPPPLLRLEKDE